MPASLSSAAVGVPPITIFNIYIRVLNTFFNWNKQSIALLVSGSNDNVVLRLGPLRNCLGVSHPTP